MPPSPSPHPHAIVLGASLAGLLTARVRSEHFDHGTLIERDPVADRAEARKGQPQTRHLHGLLASGLEIMTRYYPDLTDALKAGGARVEDFGESMHWWTYGGYRQRFTLGVKAALMSRPFLEYLVRTRTLARDNVTLIDNCAVRKLSMTADQARVTGIEIERRDQAGAGEVLAADFIVDCTGRGSRTPPWLGAVGFGPPPAREGQGHAGSYSPLPAPPTGPQFLIPLLL